MYSLEDLLVFPNYTNLEIKVSYPKLENNNKSYFTQKSKKNIIDKNTGSKYTNEIIFNTLLEMKRVLKSSIFNDDKNSANNFM